MERAMEVLRQRLLPLLEGKKIHTLLHLAQACAASERDVARALPEDICIVRPIGVGGGTGDAQEDFEELWQNMTKWECATFIMQHGGSVVEIKGQLPQGRTGGGYFNLEHGQPLGGHIRSEAVDAVGFLSLPFMGLESHSLHFFDVLGTVLFSIYVGREQRQLLPVARQSFLNMRQRAASAQAALAMPQGGRS